MKNLQEFYDYVIGALEKATAREQIKKAAGEVTCWETGEKLAYADVARRLVTLGCKARAEGGALKGVTDDTKA